MSTHSIHPPARQLRGIAWIRIKMLTGLMFRLSLLLVGVILAMFASIGLLGIVVSLFFGSVQLGRVTIGSTALLIDGHRIDTTTWWGTGVLILFDSFVLGLGCGFVKMGCGKRSGSS